MKKPNLTFNEFFRKRLMDNIEITYYSDSEPTETKTLVEKIIDLEETLASLEEDWDEIEAKTLTDNTYLIELLAPDFLEIRKELGNLDVEGIEIKLSTPILVFSKLFIAKEYPRILLCIGESGYLEIPDILKYQDKKEDTDYGE